MKHLVRLYPTRWRRRYAAEVAALVSRQRPTVAGVIDLLRGALDARLRPSPDLIFVPTIGFRPEGTRTLSGTPSVEQNETRLTVVAFAAAPLRTDVLLEWNRAADAAPCAPGTYLTHSQGAAPPDLTSATLHAGALELAAEEIARSAYGTGAYGTHAFYKLRFPPIDPSSLSATLRVREGDTDFRVELELTPSAIRARPIESAVTLDGVTVRATAAAWHGDELVIDLEVSASSIVGQVGAPLPQQLPFSAITEEVRRQRAKELQRVNGHMADPITLQGPGDTEAVETRRIFHPLGPEQVLTVQRFAVAFDAPAAEVREVTVVIPFVEVSNWDASATVDLRALPTPIAIGVHRFTVLSAEPYGSQTKVILQVPPGSGARRVMQPAGFRGFGGSYSWGRGPGDHVWFAAAVDDPPIVRFQGIVERVEGPWRLKIPLV